MRPVADMHCDTISALLSLKRSGTDASGTKDAAGLLHNRHQGAGLTLKLGDSGL